MPQSSHSQGKVGEFFCVKFMFYQFECMNFENFLGEHTPTPLINGLGLTVEFNVSPVKSWKSRGIPPLLESGKPVTRYITS